MSQILEDGGLNGRDEGYPRDLTQAYIFVREVQLANPYIDPISVSVCINKARQKWSTEELLKADSQAEDEFNKMTLSKPSVHDASADISTKIVNDDDPTAQYQLAIRLLNGKARSQSALNAIALVSQEYPLDNSDMNYPDRPVDPKYIKASDDLDKTYQTIVSSEIKQALELLNSSASKQNVDALTQLSELYCKDAYQWCPIFAG